ncbi:LOW QUALITY PROTEIN: hypothetical protein U9M48_021014 [Paspalum notatum var. saurae]|uniref:At1g61320/AtMIF1 LRR domain-containing protein n=1 Tax=Paspalum notatum var. saurae TaxID=547442 RepID=A0AAQ3TIQ2_PASNO
MPMKDAARAACVSRTFLRSWTWRCHPSLTFSEEIFGLDKSLATEDNTTCYLVYMAERFLRDAHILQNHAGIGVKALKLELSNCINIDSCCLDGWLHIAVTPGIEELTLMCLDGIKLSEYDSRAHCYLTEVGTQFDAFTSVLVPSVPQSILLNLSSVGITGDELGIFLSKYFALEWLRLWHCNEIINLKIPCLLQRLSKLQVVECQWLQAIESYAPNLSIFHFDGYPVQISFGNPLPVKNLEMSFIYEYNGVSYARTNLLSMVPNRLPYIRFMRLTVHQLCRENSPVSSTNVCFESVSSSPAYDYRSLVSFLDASPSLETFILSTLHPRAMHDSIFGNPFHPRQTLEYCHERLKCMKINGFCSARSMVELVWHILENAPSLECLTLDTTNGAARCYLGKSDKCTKMPGNEILEARRGLSAVRTYISGKVPLSVKLNVVEPCSRCHAVKIQDV